MIWQGSEFSTMPVNQHECKMQLKKQNNLVLKFNQGIVTALLWLDNQTLVFFKRQCTFLNDMQ